MDEMRRGKPATRRRRPRRRAMFRKPATDGAPFAFQKRVARIDWRALHSIDVNRLIRQVDIDTLEKALDMVAFGDIQGEDKRNFTESNFIKIFRLAQLVEYLLHVQELLAHHTSDLLQIRSSLQQRIEKMQSRFVSQRDALMHTRHELTQAKKSLQRYEVMQKGQGKNHVIQASFQSNHRQKWHNCRFCEKVFESAYYLDLHIARKHYRKQGMTEDKLFSMVSTAEEAAAAKNANQSLEKPKERDLEDANQERLSELESKISGLENRVKTLGQENLKLVEDLNVTYTKLAKRQSVVALETQVDDLQKGYHLKRTITKIEEEMPVVWTPRERHEKDQGVLALARPSSSMEEKSKSGADESPITAEEMRAKLEAETNAAQEEQKRRQKAVQRLLAKELGKGTRDKGKQARSEDPARNSKPVAQNSQTLRFKSEGGAEKGVNEREEQVQEVARHHDQKSFGVFMSVADQKSPKADEFDEELQKLGITSTTNGISDTTYNSVTSALETQRSLRKSQVHNKMKDETGAVVRHIQRAIRDRHMAIMSSQYDESGSEMSHDSDNLQETSSNKNKQVVSRGDGKDQYFNPRFHQHQHVSRVFTLKPTRKEEMQSSRKKQNHSLSRQEVNGTNVAEFVDNLWHPQLEEEVEEELLGLGNWDSDDEFVVDPWQLEEELEGELGLRIWDSDDEEALSKRKQRHVFFFDKDDVF